MARYKKKVRLDKRKNSGLKRKRSTINKGSPSPFQKRKKIQSTSSRKTPVGKTLEHISPCVNQLISPMVCKNVGIPKVFKSDIKKKLTYDEDATISPNNNVQDTCTLLQKLVEEGKFSTESISFKLFEDTLRWYNCTNTSSMRYSDEVKEFFWTGRRLLGGQFLRFMRGFAHTGVVNKGLSPRGSYNPDDTSINLPVPSDRILDDFSPSGISVSSDLKPGIIEANLELYSKFKDESFVLMFDGKKIVPNTAEVFLLDQEEEPKIEDTRAFFEAKIELASECIKTLEQLCTSDDMKIEDIEESDKHRITTKLKELLKEFCSVCESLRKTYSKKKTYLQTLERKFEENHEVKYKYAVDKIRTFLYKLRICLKDLLEVTDNVLMCCSILNGTRHLFKRGQCNLDEQFNYRELKPPSEIRTNTPGYIPSALVKQRTPEWFAIRETVEVTGSSLHRAIGLETLAAQKEHFDRVIGGREPVIPADAQIKAMSHGTENEIHAIATVVSKVLPVYYPGYTFYEEGAFVVEDENAKNIIVVSPDGSLRDSENNRRVSVEAKCPFPFYIGTTPVYYALKQRHVMQCLAEAEVMNCAEHLYVSWCKESMTVFKMKPNKKLIQKALKEVLSTYNQEVPRRPAKLSDNAKNLKVSLKEEVLKAEFVCEVPSVIGVTNPSRASGSASSHYDPVHGQSTPFESEMTMADIIQSVMKAKKSIQEAHTFQKPVASEVLIHLLSDMNRSWKLEIGHGLPVSFLYKGYSLTMNTARRVLEKIVAACFQKNIQVACIAFDGQFASMKDSDDQNRPLTLFAYQRIYWARVKTMTKRELLTAINDTFGNVTVSRQQSTLYDCDGNQIIRAGSAVVANSMAKINPIKSHADLIYNAEATSELVNCEQIGTTGLDEDMANIVEDLVVSNISSPGTEEGNETLLAFEKQSSSVQIIDTEYGTGIDVDKQNCKLILEDNDFESMYSILCSSTQSKKWQSKNIAYLKMAFESADSMNKLLIGQEIQDIVKYINVKLTKHNATIKQSMRKGKKINLIFEYLGRTSKVEIKPTSRKVKTIKSLKIMCMNELSKRTYQKNAVAVAYAESTWPFEEQKWYDSPQVCVSRNVVIESHEDAEETEFQPVYSPEFNGTRGELQVRVMDGTHMRTNIKSKIIRSGIENIKSTGWKEVAKTGETLLTPSILEVSQEGKLIHQQSDPHVRTMFCEQVESQLRLRGYVNEANFSRLFREWHEAEDMPGLSANERVRRSLNLRDWLLEKYRFDAFPPKTQYVKGIPRVTFEGLVCSIDAHVLLYAICKGNRYNWRSVSTLVAENFMGELAERSQNNYGVPSGLMLSADMTKISELHAMRMKPNRAFQMRTAKSRAYSVPGIDTMEDVTDISNQVYGEHSNTEASDSTFRKRLVQRDSQDAAASGNELGNPLLKTCDNDFDRDQQNREQHLISKQTIKRVIVRNHEFDYRAGGKVKLGTVRTFGDRPRGVQSVRMNYKVDESKLLPSLTLGLSGDMLDNI